MIFTREDILKIQNALLQLGRKDSEFKDANTPLNSDDYIAILQDGINKKVSINNLLSTLGLLKKDDFINVSDRYDEYYIQLSEAITMIANNKRKKGLVITFQDINGSWRIYQFNDEIVNFIKTEYWKDLFDFKYPIVNSILPDEEDLTLTQPNIEGNSFIQLKDKEYDPQNFSGMATKILRKHIVEVDDSEFGKVKKNILYQDDFDQENCIYEIRYDFTLTEDITIPTNCVLEFDGGSINGTYTIIFTDTLLIANKKSFNNVLFAGTVSNKEIRIEWFGIKENDSGETSKMQWFLQQTGKLILDGKTYTLAKNFISRTSSNTRIIGNNTTFNVICDSKNNQVSVVFQLINVENIYISGITITSTKDAQRILPSGNYGPSSLVQAIATSGIVKNVVCENCTWINLLHGIHSTSISGIENKAINIYFNNITSINTELSFSGFHYDNLVVKNSSVTINDGLQGRVAYLVPLVNGRVLFDNINGESNNHYTMLQFYTNNAGMSDLSGASVIVSNSRFNGKTTAPFAVVSNKIQATFDNIYSINIVELGSFVNSKILNSYFEFKRAASGELELFNTTFISSSSFLFQWFENSKIKAIDCKINVGGLINSDSNTYTINNNDIYFENCEIECTYNNKTLWQVANSPGTVTGVMTIKGCRLNIIHICRVYTSALNISLFDCDFINPFTYYIGDGDNAVIKLINCSSNNLPLDGIVKNNVLSKTQNCSSGSTRPTENVEVGYCFFDTSLSPARPIYWNGTAWIDATGTTV